MRRHSLALASMTLLVCSIQLTNYSIHNPSFARMGGSLVQTLIFPFERIHHEVTESFRYYWGHYVWLLGVESERNDLAIRIKELEAQNSMLLEFERENQRLRRLLGFTEQTGHNGVVASVVGRDPSNWIQTVTINRGSAHGLRPGLAVVDGNAIVGQTTVVTKNSSTVLLLTDSRSAIGAIVQNSRAVGVVEGNGLDEPLSLSYVQKLIEVTVNPGDRVIASGLDGVFPKGALIGVIHEVIPTENSLFYRIKVARSADTKRLESVLVILPEKASSLSSALPSADEVSALETPDVGEIE